MLIVNQRNRRQKVGSVSSTTSYNKCHFINMLLQFSTIYIVSSLFIIQQIGISSVQSSQRSSIIVDGFVMIPNVVLPPNRLYQHRHPRILDLHMKKNDDVETNIDEDDNIESDGRISMEWNDDNNDLLDDDDEDEEGNEDDDNFDIDLSHDDFDAEDYDDNDDDDDDEYDDNSNDNKDSFLLEQPYSFEMTDLDGSVQQVLQEYMETYQRMIVDTKEKTSMKQTSIIKGWFHVMKHWDTVQYNQLLNELSRIGSVHDTETILYHMIEQQQQNRNKETTTTSNGLLVNDETFYHVFASYQYQQQQEHTKKNYKNKKYRGIGYKVEQLLAIQDAIYNNTVMNGNNNDNSIETNTIQPSVRTLLSILNVMILDRFDNKIALRANRIWNRLLQLSNNNNTNEKESMLLDAVVLVLICCTHVPRMTVTPIDKLSSFTVALDCFNWATTTTSTTTSDSAMLSKQVQQQCNVYTYFLRACRVLLYDTVESKRDAVIEAAFRRACVNGYVNNKVIKALEECASDALILRLLGGFIEDGQELPLEWSRNCIVSSNQLEESVTSSNER